MITYHEPIDMGVLDEAALQSIETLLEELGREPQALEVKLFNSYNKREPKRDENYSRFNFGINADTEGIALIGTYYIRSGSKRQETPQRVVRNCFKLLTALGTQVQGQVLGLHYSQHNPSMGPEELDEMVGRLALYSNQVGVPTLDVHLRESRQFDDYTLLHVVMIGARPVEVKQEYDLSYSKLVLVTPAFEAPDYRRDLILSKLFARAHTVCRPLVFLVSGRKGIVGQLLKHLKQVHYGVRFFKEGFEGFAGELDELLVRSFKTEVVFLTRNPGELVKLAAEYNIEARIIGEITREQTVQVDENGTILCRMPTELLEDSLQFPEEEYIEYDEPEAPIDLTNIKEASDLRQAAYEVLRAYRRADKRHVLSFFDQTIRSNNIGLHFPSDAAVLKLHGQEQALAIRLNSNYNPLNDDHVEHSSVCIAQTARQLACCGVQTSFLFSNLSVKNATNAHCTELANEHMQALQRAAKGLSGQSSHFEFNLDLRPSAAQLPSRAALLAGGLGIIPDTSMHMSVAFKNKGDLIFMLGESQNCLRSSLYLKACHGIDDSSTPYIDWPAELKLQAAVRGLIGENIICSARSVGHGGLWVALVDACLQYRLGFDITSVADVRDDAFLFSEAQGRVLVSLTIHKRGRFIDYLEKCGVPFTILGHVTKGELRIEERSYGFINEIAALM